MKKTILLSLALLAHSTAQAADYNDVCYEVYDTISNSYVLECSYEPVQHVFSTTTTTELQGTQNTYFEDTLQPYLFSNISGTLTQTSWYDEVEMTSGYETTISLGPTMFFESYFWTQGSSGPEGLPEFATDFIYEEVIDINGDLIFPIAPTQWDILFTAEGSIAAAITLDADGDGIPGINIPAGLWPNGTVLDIQLQAVPVPAAFWLFASGLLGLVGVARKRNK